MKNDLEIRVVRDQNNLLLGVEVELYGEIHHLKTDCIVGDRILWHNRGSIPFPGILNQESQQHEVVYSGNA